LQQANGSQDFGHDLATPLRQFLPQRDRRNQPATAPLYQSVEAHQGDELSVACVV
jgi:hypothetical protein